MKKGVLLVNLGSPDSPEPKDVKKYLKVNLLKATSDINSQIEIFCFDCIDRMI